MTKKIYKKTKSVNLRKIFRFFGLSLIVLGLIFGLYTLLPLISWKLYLEPAYANSNFASPIPQTTLLTQASIKDLLASSIQGDNWLPSVNNNTQIIPSVANYALDIPKLEIKAIVATTDTDLNHHLVHFPGTALPPNKGNAVIFGHSTLPSLYDPKNYKTIFANILNVKIGDKLIATINNTLYTYTIINISIVDAEDTSYLNQAQDDSYLTIVTCTPPGTTWKRLIIKSRIDKI
ncbi:MAG TPA: sortase [Patescibacteria group bacterium]